MNGETEIRAVRAPWYSGVDLLVTQGEAVGVNIMLEVQEPGTIVEPTARISNQAAQLLIDDLWQAGFRPTEGAGSAGSLKATENHLKDMRAIAFKKLGIDKERS